MCAAESRCSDDVGNPPLPMGGKIMEKKTEKPEPRKIMVRKLEKLETTVMIIADPGCRNELCG